MPNYTNEILDFQWSQIYGPKRVKKDLNSFDKFIFVGERCQAPF